jgi:adenylate kinase
MQRGARLVVLGKQGAGEGAQCVRVSRRYVVPHIATGDMFRAAVKAETPLGAEVTRYMNAGELVPDELVLRMLAERLETDDTKNRGFVLDGFPRTVDQSVQLDEYLEPLSLDCVVDIEVPTSIALRRIAGRRTCADCGMIFSVDAPPKVDWICDACGGEVRQRDDDVESAIERRLDLYEKQTAPLIDRYKEQGKLVSVDGEGSIDAVSGLISEAIDAVLEKQLGNES